MTKVAAIVGPTAAGKTQVSLEVARALDAEIVSVDSMQIYRGMDIGTAKVDPAIERRVPHHLIDLRDPAHVLTVSEYQELGRAAISDIASRGKLPLLVGGSGLYFRAIVDDLRFPARSVAARQKLEHEAERQGPQALYERLSALDPAAAAKIEPTNTRRIVRALEVIEATGRRFSESDAWDRYESVYELTVVGLTRPRHELYERIERRVDEMLQQGLMQEARELARRGMGATAAQALGYRQILDAGPDASIEQVRDEIVRATKRFARRQEAWFRSDPRVGWVDASEPDASAEVIHRLQVAAGVP